MRIRLAVGVLLAGALGVHGFAGDPAGTPLAAAEERRATVRRAAAKELSDARDAPAEKLQDHAERLAGLGTDMLDAAVEFLASGRTPEGEDPPSVRVGDRERELIFKSISRIERTGAVQRLRTAAAPADEPRRRAAVISALGAVGGADAVDAMIDLVAVRPGTPAAPTARDLSVSLEDGFARSFAMEPRSVERISRRWTALPPDLRRSTLSTAALLESKESAELVAQIVERDGENALHALAEVPRVAAAASEDVRRRLTTFAEEKVADASYPGRGEAARALGHLRAESAIPALLDLLAGGDEAQRDAALWSLRAVTGLGFDGELASWKHWYEEETNWVRDQGPLADAGLSDRDPAVATAWLRRVATLRLGRDGWAERVAAAVGHSSPVVRVAACATLKQLASKAPLDRLVDALHDEVPEVRAEALATLHALSGAELPADPTAWRMHLASIESARRKP